MSIIIENNICMIKLNTLSFPKGALLQQIYLQCSIFFLFTKLSEILRVMQILEQ